MNEEVIKEKINNIETRINNYSKRIDILEQGRSASDVKIENLCKRLESQTSSINWLVGLLGTSLVGFFFYVVQHFILGK